VLAETVRPAGIPSGMVGDVYPIVTVLLPMAKTLGRLSQYLSSFFSFGTPPPLLKSVRLFFFINFCRFIAQSFPFWIGPFPPQLPLRGRESFAFLFPCLILISLLTRCLTPVDVGDVARP